MTAIQKRAEDTVQKRLRGSFGYRGAESVVNGYNAVENLTIYKAHGGTEDELERLLNLAIERAKPQSTAKEAAKALGIDIGEAQAMLDEEEVFYAEMVKHQGDYLKELKASFKKAPSEYKELSEFSASNFNRVLDNLLAEARKQYLRSRNVEWANAVNEAVKPVQAAVVKLTKQQAA